MAAYVVGKQIDDIVATLFRQTMFAEYEMLIHRQVEQGEPITVESLRSTYRSLLETYFGPEVSYLRKATLKACVSLTSTQRSMSISMLPLVSFNRTSR